MLILKLTLVPLIIGAITIIGRHWGAKMAGLLSGFPVIAGPITYFLYMEQGVTFTHAATTSTVGGVTALASFCFVYAWLSHRFDWKLSVLGAFGTYFLLAVIFIRLDLSLLQYFLISLSVVIAQIYCSPQHQESVHLTPASNTEVAIRMLCAAALVMLVTLFAKNLGAHYSGVFAGFPIATTVIAVFSHRNNSKYHAMDALRALKFGLISFLCFFYTLSRFMDPLGFNQAFTLAIIVAVGIQLGIWIVKKLIASSNGRKIPAS
jgi:uncharacterized membrane protein (GlpM family)